MIIRLYNCGDEKNKVLKNPTQVAEFDGYLRQPTSYLNPIVQFDVGDIEYSLNTNYMYIPEFGRFYFITDLINVRTNILEVHGRVDVLYTYSSQLLENYAIVAKNENLYNLYLDDGSFKVTNNPIVTTVPFPYQLGNYNLILSVAG